MPKLTRAQLTAALIGIFVLASLAVAVAAGGGFGGESDEFEVHSVEPSAIAPSSGEVGGSTASGAPTPTDAGAASPKIISDPPGAFGGIRNFEQCKAAGYPVAESYPEQCRTPDGRLFVRVID